MEGEMKADEWIAKMLEEANNMAWWYKKYMVQATTEQINQSLEDPDRAKVILYLTDLLQ
jgi:hypothetical protein